MDEARLIESRRYLSDIGVWPPPARVRLSKWLLNFDEGRDREIALTVAEGYVHVNAEEMTQATRAAVTALSTEPQFYDSPDRLLAWQSFITESIVSFPLGQSGDPTASGYTFATIAEEIGIDSNNIHTGEQLVTQIIKNPGRSIIFLDDLAATGTQFTRHWQRKYHAPAGKHSLAELHAAAQIATCFFCPVVATEKAKQKIEQDTPVLVRPAHLLESQYSLLDPFSRIVPTEMRSEIADWLVKYATRTGHAKSGIGGYGGSALAISLIRKTPNNTVPVLQWNGPETKPEWTAIVE
ncbi:hypothetical protein [Curtobacterium sp. BRB10]|uniref:phosphoribosyltransferase-like protein n=1 Tax=Curtobacterium sp. BRB10 TaxID=2962579 RepID=UPI002881F685|nr:hypothetical protein [Curtobacterium sp. BRB10]MDT0234959.1 hypothetical protein [Curtobacterium sp. BRB10]